MAAAQTVNSANNELPQSSKKVSDGGEFTIWVDPGLSWGHLEIILTSFWRRFDPTLRPFWPFLAFFLGFILVRFGPVLLSFCGFWVMFWEVDCSIKQNDAREAKICRIVQKQAFF